MERLTQMINGVPVYVGTSCEAFVGSIAAEMSVQQVREALASLAAYEDTGMEPEEVIKLQRDWSDLCTFIGECGGLDRLKELAKADKDGRVVVLPCTVGDTVYEVQTFRERIQPLEIISVYIGRMGEPFFYWELKDGIGIYQNVKGFGFSQLGKTVFLTRKEAEAAAGLEAEEGVRLGT